MTYTATDTYSAVISIRLLALIWDDCGYTGHEMLPEFGIINMNGRLYDPVLGRFFSPDPYVQFAGSPQSYNRYSYCLNNPLKYTDPSGQSITGFFIGLAIFNAASSMMRAAFNHENIWKAGAMSLLSTAVTYGIGELFKTTGSIGHELLRAGTHGAASGVLNMLGGGDFVSGFVSGAVASGIHSMPQGSDRQRLVKLMTGSAAGGLAAYALGGNFIQGAIQGLKIGLFNHYVHDQRENTDLTQDAQGNLHGELAEFVCVGDEPISLFQFVLSIFSCFNDFFDAVGESFKLDNNSTYGSNHKFYFHGEGERPFWGNQYTKTRFLSDIGNDFCKRTGWIGIALDFEYIRAEYLKDCEDLANFGVTNYYRSVKAAGECFGAFILGKLGVEVGAGVGLLGGPLGGILGGVAGGVGGGMLGKLMGGQLVHNYYRDNKLFIP